ncbi:hypothetical protein MCOR25_008950 [Pyricularia grisea]|uniref:Amino acid transporter transmembrane domain-containing protein n=1 Tax=Pyricularia grisea TaxID=148305 RepID=A0A6P8B8I2_PYRGI|nr:uncharacterized protein PgNI_04583 [Pyricularia grisea]KAI6353546.1 hypothetical protein MCOR25_008950 [Pyricularia grisea]TLD12150.1 hypothetical protein PgNI_04583 [Pyricularia grisea]
MPSSSRNPSTWDEYDGGISPHRTGSMSSMGGRSGRSVQFRDQENESLLDDDQERRGSDQDTEWAGGLRRRRSSVGMRLASIADIGGVNSMRSFTRSWARAAGFAEVIPQRPSFVFAQDQAPMQPGSTDEIVYSRSRSEGGFMRPTLENSGPSLLRQHLEAGSSVDSNSAEGVFDERDASPSTSLEPQQSGDGIDFRERERKALDSEINNGFRIGSWSGGSGSGSGSAGRSQSIFAIPPHLAAPSLGGDPGPYGTSYGSLGSQQSLNYGTVRSSGREDSPARGVSVAPSARGSVWASAPEEGPDAEVQPILVKEVEQDGKMVLTVEGQSTLPQTIFNSINVLIGVGLLSLPMGIKYAGWLCGIGFLTFAAGVTMYTAGLLSRCMNLDPSLITFSDLAFISFGSKARVATSILFTLELLAACVALIVLFADSLDLLFPGLLTVTQWKVTCAIILMPLHFMPLSLLSYSSILGIFSCFSIVLIVVINGLIKPDSPGSLIEPAATYLFPANWLTLPLSFGLLMSPWGGHSVFPNIYRDMRHPYKYKQALKVTFSFTYCLDAVTAVAGILMFGDNVADAITSNILRTEGYPRALTVLMCCFIAIIPLTKVPLNARPIITTLEVVMGVYHGAGGDPHAPVQISGDPAPPTGSRKVVIMRAAIRILTILSFLVIAILFPEFDRIMAFMGSALCFSICVTLPIAFYLKLFASEISAREKVIAWVIMLTSCVMSLVGTVWAFLPKSLISSA